MFDLPLLIQVSLVLGITKLGFFQGIGRIIAAVHAHGTGLDLHDFCYNFVQKITIVGNDKYSSRVVEQIGFKPGNTLHVQMVGRLIQEKDIRAGKQKFAQRYTGFLTAGKSFDLAWKIFFCEAEAF